MNRLTPLLVLAASSLSGVAFADDTFESQAATAQRVRNLDDVVWALTASCDATTGDDVQQRQCRLLRDARAKTLIGATLLVEPEGDAFGVGTWNAAKKSVAVTLSSCLRCGGVRIDGRPWHVTGAPPRVEGGKVTTAALYDNAKPFADEASATAWLKSLKTRRVELLVKVPEKRRWQVGGKDGLQFDVLGYRVTTPCTGAVVIASPPAGQVEPDKKACTTGADTAEVVPALTPVMVRDALKPVSEAAAACYAQYKRAGKARLEITIADDGTIAAYARTGDFKETPTGLCIDKAVRSVVFPRSQRPQTKLGYPLVLP